MDSAEAEAAPEGAAAGPEDTAVASDAAVPAPEEDAAQSAAEAPAPKAAPPVARSIVATALVLRAPITYPEDVQAAFCLSVEGLPIYPTA